MLKIKINFLCLVGFLNNSNIGHNNLFVTSCWPQSFWSSMILIQTETLR